MAHVTAFGKLFDLTCQGPMRLFGWPSTPTQTAWRRSSYYPFAIQRLLALCEPAKYFSLFADRDLYKYNTDYNQYLYNDRFRIDPGQIVVYGNGTSKNSYINFVVDYNRVTGLDSTAEVTKKLENLDVRLCYRMASFSDKSYLKIFSEKSSPNSLNSSLLLPDESYKLFLYQNPSFAEVKFSAVTVQRTSAGYSVAGYSTEKPYFEASYLPNDYIYFGREDAGLPEELLENNKEFCVNIPMTNGARSINIANSVSVIAYDVVRQNHSEFINL